MSKICILIVLSFSLPVAAQVDYAREFLRLANNHTPDDEKIALSARLSEALMSDLENADFTMDTLNIQQVKKVEIPEKKLSIYTWYFSLSDATAHYGGLIHYGKKIIPLRFNGQVIRADEKYSAENWCGGVYYDIIPIMRRGTDVYTLLSWDGNNGVTFKKSMDVLSFDKKGKASFGLPFFTDGQALAQRVVLEYPAKNSLLLEYREEEKAVISNALCVDDPKFSGVPGYYNVSDDFNVYRYENEQWTLYRHVDLRLNKTESEALKYFQDEKAEK